MSIQITPGLLEVLYWITLVAVIFSSASAVLQAGSKQFDLFGVIIIAIATGLGGGSLRDLLLDREVFWIADQGFFFASALSAIAIFIVARRMTMPHRFFALADAAGLATFAVAGTLVALVMGAPWMIASFMGVITGTVGGIFRDVLCNETPVVFQSPLYATVAWAGSLLFIGLLELGTATSHAAILAGMATLGGRLLAVYYKISLPTFRFKS